MNDEQAEQAEQDITSWKGRFADAAKELSQVRAQLTAKEKELVSTKLSRDLKAEECVEAHERTLHFKDRAESAERELAEMKGKR